MGNYASGLMVYGLILELIDDHEDIDEYEDIYELVDGDPLLRYNYTNLPKDNGPLGLDIIGHHSCDCDTIIFIKSTQTSVGSCGVEEIGLEKFMIPEGSDKLLEGICDKYRIKYTKPKWLLCVSYG